jgi:hypothetical protein
MLGAPAGSTAYESATAAEQNVSDLPAVTVGRGQGPRRVDLSTIPAGVYDPYNMRDSGRRPGRMESPISDEEAARRRAASLALAPSLEAQNPYDAAVTAPTANTAFDSMDYTECCGGGGNVPPDPELAVGPNHIVAVVNVAFEIYDKSGTSLMGPMTFQSFMNADPNCRSVFDPNVLYDEAANRFMLGIDANGTHYCIAVSQTGDPTGTWNLYSFATGDSRNFFDYPHAGVGRDAIYMGANIFRCSIFSCSFRQSRVWAFDKAAMYAGAPAVSVSQALPSSEDTPQPLNLHGFAQGTWPASGPHYFLTETNYNGATYSVFSWTDPFGANLLAKVGTVDLVASTGVAAGLPVDVPQLGGGTLQANDYRPQDFEYRNGHAWTAMTIACNPGGGTVDCIRWARIDPATATVVDSGVYASAGEYRFFADLGVDACNNMSIGYTKSSSGMYPGIWVTGRQSTDPAGQLQTETQLKAGEINYTSFETSTPRRWGDYTEMTIDPNGSTFWYLGEYAKNTGTTNGRWGTYIGSYSFGSCAPADGPPTVSITSPADGATVSGTVTIVASASDDNGVTQVAFTVDGTPIGTDTNGADGWSMSWDSTQGADGAHVLGARATDTIGQTGSDTNNVTVQNGVSESMHVGDIDASTASGRGGKWDAHVTITVHGASHGPLASATVSGSWSGGASGGGSCVTNASGQCTVSKTNINRNSASATFSVTGVTHAVNTYNGADNHDPDGDSNGTTIVVARP